VLVDPCHRRELGDAAQPARAERFAVEIGRGFERRIFFTISTDVGAVEL